MFYFDTAQNWPAPARLAVALIVIGLCACGCATGASKVTRETRFIDMDSNILHVAYSEEKRTETLSNGRSCTLSGKVKLVLPTGKRISLYQTLSASGMRYMSKDRRYEFMEKGLYCFLLENKKIIFDGVYCREK